jgi:hypothetical protein
MWIAICRCRLTSRPAAGSHSRGECVDCRGLERSAAGIVRLLGQLGGWPDPARTSAVLRAFRQLGGAMDESASLEAIGRALEPHLPTAVIRSHGNVHGQERTVRIGLDYPPGASARPIRHAASRRIWVVTSSKDHVARVRDCVERSDGSEIEVNLSMGVTGDFRLELRCQLPLSGGHVVGIELPIELQRNDPKVVQQINTQVFTGPTYKPTISNPGLLPGDGAGGSSMPLELGGGEPRYRARVTSVQSVHPTAWLVVVGGKRRAVIVTGDSLCIGRTAVSAADTGASPSGEAFVPASMLAPDLSGGAERISRRAIEIRPSLEDSFSGLPIYRVAILQSCGDFESRLRTAPHTLPTVDGKPVAQGSDAQILPGHACRIGVGFDDPPTEPGTRSGRLEVDVCYHRRAIGKPHAITIQRTEDRRGPRERIVWLPCGPWQAEWETELEDGSLLCVRSDPEGRALSVTRVRSRAPGESDEEFVVSHLDPDAPVGSSCDLDVGGSRVAIRRLPLPLSNGFR